MYELTARSVGVISGQRQLLCNICLQFVPGEMVALIGPNGAGKSTLLRVLSGYLAPDSGQCLLQGKPLADWPGRLLARQRAVMRQQNTLTFSLTVRQVISLGRAVWPRQQQPQQQIVREVAALTGCQVLLERNYLQLSGGEQQRVQLARVLAQLWRDGEPQGFLFLDEPASALDLYHQQQILRLLHRLTRQGKLMVCSVLHDLNQASLWADWVLLLHQGSLVAEGTAQQVLRKDILERWYQAELRVSTEGPQQKPQVMLLP
ncbi:heme ABC transporter ATP-binding protein [Tatumella punctata]|uniref:Heme ABC transporter ATP-binding protein n=1 Tax=Tatumella punctata TaxID=399969 RepID=A0ABW1VQ89_9GAMM